MTPDLTGFKFVLMTGRGFTPAQQAWAAIVLEGFAQLGGKRAEEDPWSHENLELD